MQRQLSIDMLRQGYHQAFRELSDIITWQKDNREQSRSEQPQVLIEDDADKLRFLYIHLTKAEEAERRR